MRVALVGAGGMAQHYRSAYARLPGVEWKLAVDPNEVELEACRRLGAARTSNRFEDALADDIDMVDISTPNHLHEQQAVAALEAGKHVILQKPMANSLEAADHILAAAAKSRGKLGMYMSAYLNPLVWEVKALMEKGLLGDIQSCRARDAHRGGLKAKPVAWRSSREQTGGGSFIQLSIHGMNLLQWWLDTSITEIFAYSENRLCPNIGGDDVTAAVARMASGPLVLVDSGYASNIMTRELYGTRGEIALVDDDRFLTVTLDAPYESALLKMPDPGKPVTITRPAGTSWGDIENPYHQQKLFIHAVRAQREPANPGQVGRRDLAVVMAAYESARTGRPVQVSPMPAHLMSPRS